MKSGQLSHQNFFGKSWRLVRGVVAMAMIVCFATTGIGTGFAASTGLVISTESGEEEVQNHSEGRLLIQHRARGRSCDQLCADFVPAVTLKQLVDGQTFSPERSLSRVAIHLIGAGINIRC